MCMFCASLPAVMAVGVAAQAQTNEKQRAARDRGETPAPVKVQPIKVALVVAGGVVAAAVAYHAATQGG